MVQNLQKVNFTFSLTLHCLDNYTSNEAESKVKTLFTAWRSIFEPFQKISKNGPKSSKKLRLTPLHFDEIWPFLVYIYGYSQLQYIWLFARANIKSYSPGRIYMVIRPGEYKKLFARANNFLYSPGQKTIYISRANNFLYSLGRITIYIRPGE